MPEIKNITVDASYVTNDNSSNMVILIEHVEDNPNLIKGNLNLSQEDKFVNNKQINPANLGLILKNGLNNIDAFIDKNGHLIVSGDEAGNYSLNEQGHLIFTKEYNI